MDKFSIQLLVRLCYKTVLTRLFYKHNGKRCLEAEYMREQFISLENTLLELAKSHGSDTFEALLKETNDTIESLEKTMRL